MRPSSLAIPVRVALAVMIALTTLAVVLPTSVSSASAHGTAADPTVSDPILPSSGIEPATLGTTFPLSQVGYEQSEYFVSGTATSYVPTSPLTLDGRWSVTPDSTAPYETRVVVNRPIDPRKFNGTVLVEWLNVSGGLDDAPDWVLTHNELIRDGFAWVGVSAQSVGINALKSSDPTRYGPLSDPGDSYSYDIFSQAGQAVWDSSAQLLGGLTAQHVMAMGESQSADRLTTYIDGVAPVVNVYNGYLVHSRIGSPSSLSQSPQPPVTVPTSVQFRSDLSTPVFEFETETDVSGTTLYDRQPNTNQFRLWEVPGGSHFDYYGLFVGPTDTGNGQGAISNLAAMQSPPSTVSGLGTCTNPINTSGTHWVLNAAVWWLNRWVVNGLAPPVPPLMQVTTTPGEPVVFATDANGNVLGGVRSPQVDVPIATLSGVGNSGGLGGFCALFGRTIPFSSSQLASLYPTHFQFVLEWDLATLKDWVGGYLLVPDLLELDNSALVSNIGG
ncbi:MAG TPA: alpha/beta hydrolase domain-containing protein [Acidimicrobiales bacterium]